MPKASIVQHHLLWNSLLDCMVPSFSHGLCICCFSVPSQGLCFTVIVSVNNFSGNIAITSDGFRLGIALLFPLYKLFTVIKNNDDPVIMFIPKKTPAEHLWVAWWLSKPLTGMRRERCGHSQRTPVVVEKVLSLPSQNLGLHWRHQEPYRKNRFSPWQKRMFSPM